MSLAETACCSKKMVGVQAAKNGWRAERQQTVLNIAETEWLLLPMRFSIHHQILHHSIQPSIQHSSIVETLFGNVSFILNLSSDGCQYNYNCYMTTFLSYQHSFA